MLSYRADTPHFEVDDRFLADWVSFGFDRLEAYLANHARFAAFCERRERSTAAEAA